MTYYFEVSPMKAVHRTNGTLIYSYHKKLSVGHIVSIPLGKNFSTGIVVEKTSKPSFETKDILSVINTTPLPMPLVKIQAWISEYYATHPAVVWRTMLPGGLSKTRRQSASDRQNTSPPARRTSMRENLTKEQKSAIEDIISSKGKTTLLHGVTGSGKTRVYIESAIRCFKNNQSTIVILPEIALTSQIVAEFAPHFNNIFVTHSSMTESDRHKVWLKILESDKPTIIIGPRSALFMPVKNLGLVIVDECHEPSLKQERNPHYWATRVARMLCCFSKAKLVIGSATPLVTDYFIAKKLGQITEMKSIAVKNTTPPEVDLISLSDRSNFSESRVLSKKLINDVETTINTNGQVLFYHNRRGSATITLCDNCGWQATCNRCFLPLTLHADTHTLCCHLCNFTQNIIFQCPECSKTNIIHKGVGTKKIVEELSKIFPKANIARFDGDTEVGLEKRYQEIYDGDIDIIVGTQVVAKGLDLPKLRLVAIVQADNGLSMPDYSANERVFQLLTQAIGRVGRNESKSKVIIQSYQPNHPSVLFSLSQDYSSFYNWCLLERKRANFPPFCHLLKLNTTYKTEKGAINASKKMALIIKKELSQINDLEIIGPTPAFYERSRNTYKWQIVIKSKKRESLVQLLKKIPTQGWQSELDPVSLL